MITTPQNAIDAGANLVGGEYVSSVVAGNVAAGASEPVGHPFYYAVISPDPAGIEYTFALQESVDIATIADLDADGNYQYDAGDSQPRLLAGMAPLQLNDLAIWKFGGALEKVPYDLNIAPNYHSDPQNGQWVTKGRQNYRFQGTPAQAIVTPATAAVGDVFAGWERLQDT